jgi:hypothetical protein
VRSPPAACSIAYSHNLLRRGRRYLCEFMERTRQRQATCQSSRSSDQKMDTFKGMPSRSTVRVGAFPATIPFHFDEKDPGCCTPDACAPSAVLNAGPFTNPTPVSHIYQSFMNQEWNDLPEGVTPNDIIWDIVDTFRNV